MLPGPAGGDHFSSPQVTGARQITTSLVFLNGYPNDCKKQTKTYKNMHRSHFSIFLGSFAHYCQMSPVQHIQVPQAATQAMQVGGPGASIVLLFLNVIRNLVYASPQLSWAAAGGVCVRAGLAFRRNQICQIMNSVWSAHPSRENIQTLGFWLHAFGADRPSSMFEGPETNTYIK